MCWNRCGSLFAPLWDVIFTKGKEWSDRIYYKISYKVEKLNFEFIQPLISGLTPDHLFCFFFDGFLGTYKWLDWVVIWSCRPFVRCDRHNFSRSFYTDTVPWSLVFKGSLKIVFVMILHKLFLFTAFPERTTCITGVPFCAYRPLDRCDRYNL